MRIYFGGIKPYFLASKLDFIESTKEECDWLLYTASPRRRKDFRLISEIAECIDMTHKQPVKVIFLSIPVDMDDACYDIFFDIPQTITMSKVGDIVSANGGQWFVSLDDMVQFLKERP